MELEVGLVLLLKRDWRARVKKGIDLRVVKPDIVMCKENSRLNESAYNVMLTYKVFFFSKSNTDAVN